MGYLLLFLQEISFRDLDWSVTRRYLFDLPRLFIGRIVLDKNVLLYAFWLMDGFLMIHEFLQYVFYWFIMVSIKRIFYELADRIWNGWIKDISRQYNTLCLCFFFFFLLSSSSSSSSSSSLLISEVIIFDSSPWPSAANCAFFSLSVKSKTVWYKRGEICPKVWNRLGLVHSFCS